MVAQDRAVIINDVLQRGAFRVLSEGGHARHFIMRRTFVDFALPRLTEAAQKRADAGLGDVFAVYPHDVERELAAALAPFFGTVMTWLFGEGWPPSWIEALPEAFGDVVAPPIAHRNVGFGGVDFVYARFDNEIQTMAADISVNTAEVYVRAVDDFRAGFGLDKGFEMTQAIQSKLDARAIEVAKKAAQSYNTALATAVQKIRPDVVSRAELEAASLEWAELYAERQAVTIARTEVATAQAMAVMDAAQAMGIEEQGEWWFYGSLICSVCVNINADCPFTYGDAMGIGIPHPRCGDSWHFHAAPSVKPARDWRGALSFEL